MTSLSDNKYANLEKQIDEILSEGKLYLLPPGFWVFLFVNLLLMVCVAALVVVAQSVLFVDQMERAMTFSAIAGITLAIVIVTPPFLVLRGFRKALLYLKVLIFVLSALIFLFALANMVSGVLGLYAASGFISAVSAYLLVKSDSYQLLSIFTARRRELVLEKLERKRQVVSK